MAYIGQQPVNTFSQVPTKDSFTGDGSTTTFDLGNAVVSSGENSLEVFVNNVRQEPGSGKAFTLGPDGSDAIKRITFSAAPASGAAIYVINDKTSNTSIIRPTDLNGTEFILDADADTSITADTDDTVHLKIGGASYDAFTFTAGQLDMKTDGTAGVAQIRLYCESSNAHYAALQPQPHSAGVSPTVTLPKYTGTLVADTTFVGATDTVSGDGSSTDAISLATMISFLDTSSGTSSLTLATGVDGQIKKIIMEVAGNAATLTQSNGNLVASQVSTSIVFDAVGESATLIYSASLSKWLVFDVRGATVS